MSTKLVIIKIVVVVKVNLDISRKAENVIVRWRINDFNDLNEKLISKNWVSMILCLRCSRNNHRTKESRIQPDKLTCKACQKSGHVEKVCISSLLKQKRDDRVEHLSEEEDIQTIHTIIDDSKKIMIPVTGKK